jgi:UPF0042 nucleotide-binding protein
MIVKVITFGHKYGMPEKADMMFDVRCLTNPFWVEELKEQTGFDYVFSFENSRIFFEKLCNFLDFIISQYQIDGREELVIAIGCTGGRHRSVAIAERLSEYYGVASEHRDVKR